jgi:hypothetical protein
MNRQKSRSRADCSNVTALSRPRIHRRHCAEFVIDPGIKHQSPPSLTGAKSGRPRDATAYPITHKKAMPCQAKASSKNSFH